MSKFIIETPDDSLLAACLRIPLGASGSCYEGCGRNNECANHKDVKGSVPFCPDCPDETTVREVGDEE